MRVPTSAMYTSFLGRQQTISSQLYETNRKSDGKEIQYGYQDLNIYNNTLRLEEEEYNLSQIKQTTQSAQSFANTTDTTLSSMSMQLERFKTLLLQAANDSNANTNYQAIASELTTIQSQVMNLSNTSINGQYLFSGTALSVKPVDDQGVYQGNDGQIEVFSGSHVRYAQNIDGKTLFLGDDNDYARSVTTNVRLLNQTKLDPTLTDPTVSTAITTTDTIGDLTGTQTADSYFYIDGRKSDGTSFKTRITMTHDATVDDLLTKIANVYDNQVSVSLTTKGQIEIKDKTTGSSQLQFHIVAADQAVTDISTLSGSGAKITEFIKSDFTLATGLSGSSAIYADSVAFKKAGSSLTSNIPQVVKGTNDMAQASTLLKDVAGSTLTGSAMTLQVTDVNGVARTLSLSFAAGGISVSGAGTGADPFMVRNATGGTTLPDTMTYGQLQDVMSMAVSGTFPATDTQTGYETAIANSKQSVVVAMDQRGVLTVTDQTTATTKASFAMFATNATAGYTAFTSSSTMNSGSALSFTSNSAITIDDPKVSLFDQLQDAIDAVKNGLTRPDAASSEPRSSGIQGAISSLTHLLDHVERSHTKNGAITNAITSTQTRTETLITNTKVLKSSYIDSDVAEVTLQLNQLSITYQAMMSGIAKVSQLSLANYL